MITLMTPADAEKALAQNTRSHRLRLGLTQLVLSKRCGVALATIRKFEQTGRISLESFLKIHMSLGTLGDVVKATEYKPAEFSTIDQVINAKDPPLPKRGKKRDTKNMGQDT